MSEPVLSRKRQGAQDAVETLETFEAFDKHGLPAFVRGVDAEALYFFLALFRTGTHPRAAEQLGISLSSANRMLAKLRTYWDDPLFVRSGFQMQPTTAAKRRYDKVLSLMHVLEDLRRGGRTDFPHGLLVFCGESGHFSRGGGVLEQSGYEGPFYGPHAFCRGHLHDGRSARTDIRMGTRPAVALRLSAVFRHFVCRLFRLALF